MTQPDLPPHADPAPRQQQAADTQTRVVAVEIRGQGDVRAQATWQISSLTDRARFKRAARTAGILVGIAFATLFIPIVHYVAPLAFLIGAGLFGIYSGSFCFYLVFHALVHPNRAGRYVAVNEALVGLTGFLAPLAGGALADHCGSQYPYLVVAALTIAVTALQICVHRARPGSMSASLEQTL